MENIGPSRVVNLRYKVWGLSFDAAIDCNWELHCYDNLNKDRITPIELYCFDHTDWGIRMIYQKLNNTQPTSMERCLLHTEVELWEIIEETKKWIEEETNSSKPGENENTQDTLF